MYSEEQLEDMNILKELKNTQKEAEEGIEKFAAEGDNLDMFGKEGGRQKSRGWIVDEERQANKMFGFFIEGLESRIFFGKTLVQLLTEEVRKDHIKSVISDNDLLDKLSEFEIESEEEGSELYNIHGRYFMSNFPPETLDDITEVYPHKEQVTRYYDKRKEPEVPEVPAGYVVITETEHKSLKSRPSEHQPRSMYSDDVRAIHNAEILSAFRSFSNSTRMY